MKDRTIQVAGLTLDPYAILRNSESTEHAIAFAFETILHAIGENPGREGLLETPERFAKAYKEIFSGIGQDPKELLRKGFDEEDHHELVIVDNIPFYSMCEHHFVPFFGRAHIGYIPDGRVVGISKLARVLEAYARRPQIQERLTSQIADDIMEVLEPQGCAVVIEAEHMCMTMRGAKKPGTVTKTSAMRGSFMKHELKQEFMMLIGGTKKWD